MDKREEADLMYLFVTVEGICTINIRLKEFEKTRLKYAMEEKQRQDKYITNFGMSEV